MRIVNIGDPVDEVCHCNECRADRRRTRRRPIAEDVEPLPLPNLNFAEDEEAHSRGNHQIYGYEYDDDNDLPLPEWDE